MVKLFTRSMNSKIFISKKEKKEFFLNEFNKKLIHHQRKSKEFSKILGFVREDEIVHKDNLVNSR